MHMIPEILYDSEALLVLNKPVGLMVHGDGRNNAPTLSDWLVEEFPAIKDVGEPWVNPQGVTIFRPGIVHRLDRDTSGILLVAKTQDMFDYLKEQFQKRTLKKEYRALVHGILSEDSGTIERPIGKSASDFRRWSAQRGAKGDMREAITKYKVIQRCTHIDDGTGSFKDYTYVALFPETGRTHQLRVHMKAIHHPIVCDALYGPQNGCGMGFTTLALHAYRITLTMRDGLPKTFEAPLPQVFVRLESPKALT
jgi:23S rRNA pseudouridine1911/1915/1917 synthase